MPNQFKKDRTSADSTAYVDHCRVTKYKKFNKIITKRAVKFIDLVDGDVTVTVLDTKECATSQCLRKMGYNGKITAITNNSRDFPKMEETARHMTGITCEKIDADEKYDSLEPGPHVIIDDGNSTWRKTKERIAKAVRQCGPNSLFLTTNCVRRNTRGKKTRSISHEYKKIKLDIQAMAAESGKNVIRRRVAKYQQAPGKQVMYPDMWIFWPIETIDLTQ